MAMANFKISELSWDGLKKMLILRLEKYQLSVAQLVEQMTLNHRAEGSSPSGETKFSAKI